MATPSLTEALRETLALFGEPDVPQTTTEVADSLDVGRRSTYERLERLVEHDRLETKKVGANGRVWWRPKTVSTDGQLTRPRNLPAGDEFQISPFEDRKFSKRASQNDRKKRTSPVSAADRDANFSLDPEGRVRTWSHDAEALTGWSEAEILDELVTGLYVDGLADETGLNQVLETARLEGHFENERRCERPTGTEFSASTTITPHPTDNDDVSGYTVVLRDETDRRRVESERHLLADVSRTVATTESFTDGVQRVLSVVTNHTQWAYGEAWAPAANGEQLEYIVGHAEDEAL